LEILVVRHPSFTWNPIHHSAHLPGSAVHLIGSNRTRIGAGGPSIINTSFGWRLPCGQIDHHRPTPDLCSVGGVLHWFTGSVGVLDAAAPLGGDPPPPPARPSARRALHRLAVSIG
jgi:hypothetical protein